jgi:hypothetical protein
MKVKIELTNGLTIYNVEDDDEQVSIAINGEVIACVRIEELKTALRKMTAK